MRCLAGGTNREWKKALSGREIVVEEFQDVGVAALTLVEVLETELAGQSTARFCKTLDTALDAVGQDGERLAIAR